MRGIKGQMCLPDLKKIMGMVLSSPRKEADPWQAFDRMGFEMGDGGVAWGRTFTRTVNILNTLNIFHTLIHQSSMYAFILKCSINM